MNLLKNREKTSILRGSKKFLCTITHKNYLNCLYKIDYTNDQLYIKSDLCIHNDWFATGDKVELKYKIPQLGYFPILYYKGRI